MIQTDFVKPKKYYMDSRSKGKFYNIIERRKSYWIGHSLRINYFLKGVIEETIERRKEKTWKKTLAATG